MNQLLHILHYKILAVVAYRRHISMRRLAKDGMTGLVFLAFAVGSYFFTTAMIRYSLTVTHIGIFLLHEFISMALFVFFTAVNVGNIVVAYSTLYRSDEVQYLMTKPLAPFKIYLLKTLDNFFYSSGTLIMILLAAVFGYANYFQLGIVTTLSILLFYFVPFLISAGLLGVLLLVLMMRLALKIGFKPLISGLVILYFMAYFLFFKISSPIHLVNAVLAYYPNIDQYFGELIPLSIKLLPNNWLAMALYWLTRGDIARSLRYVSYQIGLAAGLLGLVVLVGKRFYYQTWLRLPSIRNRQNTVIQPQQSLLYHGSIAPPSAESILKRDLLLFLREPSQMLHLGLMLFLILIFSGSLYRITLLGARNPQLQTVIYLTVFSFILFLISALALRFIFPLISLEGNVFWKIRSAPLSSYKLMLWKLVPPFLIILLIGEILNYVASYHFHNYLVVVGTVITALVSASMVCLNFGMGGLFAVYGEKSPIRIASSQGATISFLLNMVFLVLVVALLYLPLIGFFENGNSSSGFRMLFWFLGILSLLISTGSVWLGIRSYRKDF